MSAPSRTPGDRSTDNGSAVRLLARPRVRSAAWFAFTVAAALVLAAGLLKVWRGSLSVPYFLGGIDTAPFLAAVKGIIDQGWYFTNPLLGAPAGQDLVEFAGGTAENLQWVIIKILATLTGDAAVTANVYFLLAFPAIAGASWLVLRRLGGAPLTASVAAILFALLPYHFAQAAMGHQFLAAYVAVPLGGWLIVRALLGQPLFVRRTAKVGARSWVTRRNAAMAGALIVVGGSTLYYATFTLLLLVGAGVVRVVVARSWRGGASALSAFVGVAFVLALNLLPGVLHRVTSGPNPALAVRRPFESEVFSLSLTQLLVPVQGHRLGALARAYDKSVESTTIVGERGNQLGTVLAIALVGGLVALCAWALGSHPSASRLRSVGPSASVGALMALLLATFGGIGGLIAIYVSPQLRVWSRLTPFIAFFAVVLLVLGLDWARGWLRRRSGSPWPGVIVVVIIGVVGVLDQVPARVVPDYAAAADAWESTDRFVQQVEAAVSPGSSVVQLPYVPFPESGAVGGVGPYDHLAPYLHSDGLRWSFGAMRGRTADWQSTVAGLPPTAMVDAAAAAGFAGVYLDTAGYADGGAEVRRAVTRAVGHSAEGVSSPDGRRQFFSLDGARANLTRALGVPQMAALARTVEFPVRWTLGRGFYGEETDGLNRWNWATSPAVLVFQNPAPVTQRVRFSADIEAQVGSVVTWSYANGRTRGKVSMRTPSRRVSITVQAPPGQSELVLRTTGASVAPPTDGRDLRINVRNPSVLALPDRG